jgi:hypothetical protein
LTIQADGVIHPNYAVGFDKKEVDGAGEAILGIAMYNSDNYADNDYISVVFGGIYDAMAGGTIAVGDPISTKSDGTFVKATALSATVPSGATPVTSTSATPAMTIAGAYTPAVVIGYAVTAASSGSLFSLKLI